MNARVGLIGKRVFVSRTVLVWKILRVLGAFHFEETYAVKADCKSVLYDDTSIKREINRQNITRRAGAVSRKSIVF